MLFYFFENPIVVLMRSNLIFKPNFVKNATFLVWNEICKYFLLHKTRLNKIHCFKFYYQWFAREKTGLNSLYTTSVQFLSICSRRRKKGQTIPSANFWSCKFREDSSIVYAQKTAHIRSYRKCVGGISKYRYLQV